MKKSSLMLSTTLLLSAAAVAQKTDSSIGLHLPTEKGSLMIGSSLVAGEMAFGSTNGDGHLSGTYNVSLVPKVAYFVRNNLALGGILNVNVSGNSFGTSRYSGYSSKAVGAGVFARQYFGKALSKVGSLRKTRFFIEGGAIYSGGWGKFKSSDSTTERATFRSGTVYVMPGFNYFFTKNVALEGGLNFSHTGASNNVHIPANRIGVNLGLQIFLGKR